MNVGGSVSMPRASLYPGMAHATPYDQYPGSGPSSSSSSSSTAHLLSSSLSSLSQTVSILQHTNSLLSHCVSDVPRLTLAMTSRRHFDVVTEGTVQEAKRRIEDEMRPLLRELIQRGEEGVGREEMGARRVRNKVSQLTTRLEQLLASKQIKIAPPPGTNRNGASAFGDDGDDLMSTNAEEERARAEEQRQLDDLERVKRRRAQLERELLELEEEVEREVSRARRARSERRLNGALTRLTRPRPYLQEAELKKQ